MDLNIVFIILIFLAIALLAALIFIEANPESIAVFKEVVSDLVAGFLGFIVRDITDKN